MSTIVNVDGVKCFDLSSEKYVTAAFKKKRIIWIIILIKLLPNERLKCRQMIDPS